MFYWGHIVWLSFSLRWTGGQYRRSIMFYLTQNPGTYCVFYCEHTENWGQRADKLRHGDAMGTRNTGDTQLVRSTEVTSSFTASELVGNPWDSSWCHTHILGTHSVFYWGQRENWGQHMLTNWDMHTNWGHTVCSTGDTQRTGDNTTDKLGRSLVQHPETQSAMTTLTASYTGHATSVQC